MKTMTYSEKLTTETGLIRASGLFDAAWYLETYPDVAVSAMDPALHYLVVGARLARDPGPLFDAAFYAASLREPLAPAENPLVHYLARGYLAGLRPAPRARSFALVMQFPRPDLIDSLAGQAAGFPGQGNRYLILPDDLGTARRAALAAQFPGVAFVSVPGPGRGVAALLAAMEQIDLNRYGTVCVIGRPRDPKMPPETWIRLLKATLGEPSEMQSLMRRLIEDPRLRMAGSGRAFMQGANAIDDALAAGLSRLCGTAIKGLDARQAEWGYFREAVFWISADVLITLRDGVKALMADPATGSDAAMLSEVIRRGPGLLIAAADGKVLLTDDRPLGAEPRIGTGLPRKNVGMAAPPGLPHAPKAAMVKPDERLKGALTLRPDRPVIGGWLAMIGQEAPRQAILRIGQTEIIILAAAYRDDLRERGINTGRHAFSVTVPGALLDGQSREVVLIDAETGRPVARKTCHWDRQQRSYRDFEGFLKSSMTQPLIEAPFTEEDKRCFAVMENLANRLCARAAALKAPPLVSVIMPVHDRAAIVAEAISSVLAQSYRNLELIVIDDGSTDSSAEVIKGIADERIRLIRHAVNQGQAHARNTGLAAVRGEIVAYLDSDNHWDDRYIAAVVGAFDQLPEADALHSGILLFRGQDRTPCAMRYGHMNRALLENRNYIDMNIFAHRRGILAAVQGFDATLRRYPDYDLILRISEVGRMFSLPVLLCHYFYDKAENTMTNDGRHVGDIDLIQDRLRQRQADRLARADVAELGRPVTVVIPNWQSPEDIRDCLDALTGRDWKGKLDIVVVDNASDPEVVAYLRAAARTERITLIENRRNFGFTYAVNQGIARARPGSDILLLNNDAIVQGGAVALLQRACYRLPEAGMTVPRQILPPGTRSVTTHVPYANERNPCDVNLSAHHGNIVRLPLFHDGGVVEISYAPFFAVYVRRDVLDDLGRLDAEYGRHYRSDRVYCDLMRHVLGRKAYYVPDAFVIHKLQKATDALRTSDTFDLMFRRNQWDEALRLELDYRAAAWDRGTV